MDEHLLMMKEIKRLQDDLDMAVNSNETLNICDLLELSKNLDLLLSKYHEMAKNKEA
jgi:hypothetical protein